MAKLGDLVVRIGADTRDLNKSLGRVQRNLRGMTSNIKQLGQDMTRSLSLPLTALGAAAIKSAADLETLETSFVSLTGGVEEAAFMMKQLNEFTAKTPFQIDEVANSARQLIASGTEISQVNEQLQFLGDIAATSGKSIEEIAAVFAKVQAKGKVELESLNQLAERGIPIFTALSDATGLPAEKLGAGRVTVEQFNAVLKSFAEEGGFASGAMERLSQTAAGKFSTALDNAKQALASLGELFLPVITAMLERVTSLSQAFVNLSPFVKRIIVVVGTFVGALGPLLIMVPQLIGMMTALRAITLGLNIAMAANPALLVAAGIAALTAAVVGYHMDVSSAVQTTHDWRMELLALNNEQKKIKLEENIVAANDALVEHTKILDRFRQLRDDANLPSEQASWQRAMDEHQKIIDQINGQLNDYNAELIDVEAALLQAAKAQSKLNAASKDGVDTLGKLFSKLEEAAGGTRIYAGTLDDLFRRLYNTEAYQVAQTAAERAAEAQKDMANAIANSFQSAAAQAATFREFLGNITKDIVTMFLRQAAAAAIASGNFAKAFAIAVGGGLVQRVGQNVPALANGGLAYGPTMAMVGDNRNAAIDPEVVAPLSKLKDMMGGGVVEVVGRIKGDDIFLSNARNSSARNRYT